MDLINNDDEFELGMIPPRFGEPLTPEQEAQLKRQAKKVHRQRIKSSYQSRLIEVSCELFKTGGIKVLDAVTYAAAMMDKAEELANQKYPELKAVKDA